MLQDPYFYVTVWLGLCLGSFATALSWRLPRGLSMVKIKRSGCPACHHELGPRDLVPLFSWLFLRGKCRYCKAKIGARYPLIELATLALCIAFYIAYGFTAQSLALFALAPVLASIVDIDLHYKIIPDELNLAVLLLGIAACVLGPGIGSLPSALIAAGAYGAGSWALRAVFAKIRKREPLGLGDVKFFGAAGFWLGLDPDAASLFLILSGGCGVALALVWKKISGEKQFPFGPALVLAFVIVILSFRPFL